MKWKLGKAGNEYNSEGMCRSGLFVREAENFKEVAKTLGASEFGATN
jgi:hypothetical protein